MDEFILDPAFANENPDFWALNDLQIFDINRQMYDFDEVATATKRIQRLYEKRPNPMDSVHSPSQIRDMFRFYPEQIVQLCELLEEDLKPRTKRNNSISVVTHVCTALHYFGTGCQMMCAAENRHIKTSKSSVARSVDKFVEAMLKRKDDFIYFPNTEDAIDQYKQDFFTYTGIPNTIGAIDGTHVPIVCPRSRDAIQFYNRKGFPSINVALVCGARRRILSINPCWPGSCHDSVVFKNSKLFADFEAGKYNGYILGDSAYALRHYLMTPFLNATTPAQEAYNEAQKSSRTVIENGIGNWKERFNILNIPMRHAPKKCSDIITVTACLNNFALSEGDMWCTMEGVFSIEQHDPLDNYHYYDPEELLAVNSGKRERDKFVADFYA